MKHRYHVCALLYGNYVDHARRCVDSLLRYAQHPWVLDVRLGLNAVGDETLTYLAGVLPRFQRVFTYRNPQNENLLKYPVMRRMLYSQEPAIVGERLMWFDDDSWLTPAADAVWWEELDAAAATATVVGSRWRIAHGLRGAQPDTIMRQIWWPSTAPRLRSGSPVTFITGGWWVADLEFLRRWGYPFPELRHNGGDVMLGMLCQGQKQATHDIRTKDPKGLARGVCINADKSGRCSSALRRGYREEPLWVLRHVPRLATKPIQVLRFGRQEAEE